LVAAGQEVVVSLCVFRAPLVLEKIISI
jgi:hypothetical protein